MLHIVWIFLNPTVSHIVFGPLLPATFKADFPSKKYQNSIFLFCWCIFDDWSWLELFQISSDCFTIKAFPPYFASGAVSLWNSSSKRCSVKSNFMQQLYSVKRVNRTKCEDANSEIKLLTVALDYMHALPPVHACNGNLSQAWNSRPHVDQLIVLFREVINECKLIKWLLHITSWP